MNKRWRKRSLELFCPAEFHHISGVDVCLAFCRKKKCFVFNGHERVAKGLRSGMKSRAVRPKLKWENPHLVAHNFDALKLANPAMSDWMINEFLRISVHARGMHAITSESLQRKNFYS